MDDLKKISSPEVSSWDKVGRGREGLAECTLGPTLDSRALSLSASPGLP